MAHHEVVTRGPRPLDENAFRSADQLYIRIGRIVASTNLVESQTLNLLRTFDGSSETHYRLAAEPGTQVLKPFRTHIGLLTEPLRAEMHVLLDDVMTVLKERNLVAHTVWPTPGDADGYGWKALRRNERESESDWITDHNLTTADLDRIIERIDSSLERLFQAQLRCRTYLAAHPVTIA